MVRATPVFCILCGESPCSCGKKVRPRIQADRSVKNFVPPMPSSGIVADETTKCEDSRPVPLGAGAAMKTASANLGLDVHMVSAIRTLYRGGLIDDKSAEGVVAICEGAGQRRIAEARDAWKWRNNSHT